MYAALNSRTWPDDLAPGEQLVATARAGFAGLELVLSDDGPLCAAAPMREFAAVRRRAEELDLRIVGLATGAFWQFNYASSTETERRRALELTVNLLDRAVAAGAGAVLVVPAVVGRMDEASPRTGYAEAWHRTLEALHELRHEAEARGVALAVENVWNRFLLSPLELAGLIDEVNSPCVGVYLDVGNCLAYGYPQDWIALLGGRIVRVHAKDYDLSRPGYGGFCGLGAGSIDWPAVVSALQQVGYDGAVTYEGAGEPAEICRRLRVILAGSSPVDKERS
jgi:hexulose-6-phosphate isomerase